MGIYGCKCLESTHGDHTVKLIDREAGARHPFPSPQPPLHLAMLSSLPLPPHHLPPLAPQGTGRFI